MSTEDHTGSIDSAPARRSVLRGAAVLGAAGAAAVAVSGCGPASGSGSSSKSPKAGDAGAPITVGKVSDVPVGSGVVFGDTNVVVTQPAAGQFHAFDATCTHQGCQVQKIANGVINCPCHGSEFAIADGSVVRGPASKPLKTMAVSVQDGNLVVG